jgi:hypothetical protein
MIPLNSPNFTPLCPPISRAEMGGGKEEAISRAGMGGGKIKLLPHF